VPKNVEFFHGLDDLGAPRRGLAASVGVHIVVLSVLLLVPLIFTDSLKVKYNTVQVVPPPKETHPLEVTNYSAPPKPLVRPVLTPPPVVKPVVVPDIPQPHELPKPEPIQPKIPKIETVEAPVLPPKPVLVPQPAPAPAAPKMAIRMDSFATATAAEPTTKLQTRDVQTGGFGDPNGSAAKNLPNKIANVASLGSFDLPTGAGAGNGSGGAQGTRAVVASSGFGNSGGAAASNGGTRDRSLKQSGFGDVQAAAPAPSVQKKTESAIPDTPAEITSKPKPDYTDEARKLRLEGEVLLRAVFSASGEVRVLDVVRGLGHGLDENAIRAAQQIRFKPALKDGHPVDSTVTVHIIFQLAF
jgi:TonB family protein